VLENLGTFQAVSYAMIREMGVDSFKEKYPLLVEENVLSHKGKEVYTDYWENILEMAVKTLQVGDKVTFKSYFRYISIIFSPKGNFLLIRLTQNLKIKNMWSSLRNTRESYLMNFVR